MRHRRQSGQVLVIVAVWLLALIGSAALILLTGSVEWQRNQVQQLADQAALDAAQKIGIGCSAGSASTVLTEADNFVATQRTRTGVLTIGPGTCAAGYTGADTFATSMSETIHYPYRSYQQQVEVILTVSLPISFGSYLGASNTNVTRRAVAMQLAGSTSAITAGTLSCTGGQFNVGGSILVSNAITLSGGCAVYAHDRFDAASGTYSALGNVSVYANAQTWVGAGGACVAGANAGSSNALCADGYERDGHNSLACGASGTSAFLSAGDALRNSNPCAAGKAPQYVPPVPSLLPPEPNTDPAAKATLPGGTACSAAAVYPNLVVGGATVGTAEAGTPAPTKDASNFYHFKPSCYGYLNVASLSSGGGSITNRQVGPETGPTTNSVTPTLTAVSATGTLLVAMISAGPSTVKSTPPAGWVFANGVDTNSEALSEIWYYPNNPGGINSATFTLAPGNSAVGQMTEWSGALAGLPLDQTGTLAQNGNISSITVSTSGAMTQANELVITNISYGPDAAATYTGGAGYSSLAKDPAKGYSSDVRTNLPAGIASETATLSDKDKWAAVIATFKPLGGGGGAVAGAVLDPGFYYFNGSGFPGGGGICLNGTATLLGRDVTLEFVNQAGFSTGTCLAGGGVGCIAACQFGSSSAADGVYTWFAAPCNAAPAGDASCPGSAWCPAGDRACWNLLVWAPAGSTGQVAINGAGASQWLLGSTFWPGACIETVNGTSKIDGNVYCGTLSVSAGPGAGVAIGSDYGISTALVEAVLLE